MAYWAKEYFWQTNDECSCHGVVWLCRIALRFAWGDLERLLVVMLLPIVVGDNSAGSEYYYFLHRCNGERIAVVVAEDLHIDVLAA